MHNHEQSLLVGPDGAPLRVPSSAATEAADEKLGETSDIDAIDSLGVPFYKNARYFEMIGKPVDPDEYGKRIPKPHRRHLRNRVKELEAAAEKWKTDPVQRQELVNLVENVLQPIGKQSQALSFQLTTLIDFLIELNLFSKEEFQQRLQQRFDVWRATELKSQMLAKGISPEEAENAMKALDAAPLPDMAAG